MGEIPRKKSFHLITCVPLSVLVRLDYVHGFDYGGTRDFTFNINTRQYFS